MGTEKSWKWKNCIDCGKQIKRFRKYKGKILCFNCYQKKITIIGHKIGFVSLKKALSKTYEIRGYLTKHDSLIAQLSFPSILAGYKVKLQLVK